MLQESDGAVTGVVCERRGEREEIQAGAMDRIEPLLAPDGYVLSLQNGLNKDQIEAGKRGMGWDNFDETARRSGVGSIR